MIVSAGERILAVLIIAPLALAGFIGIMFVIGTAIEVVGENISQHERCLKQATNGLEIERCR